jgi:hypothetical protein
VSEYENPARLIPGREPTAEDIRSLAGPVTPHFALQVRKRISRLVERLPEGHPARAEGERQMDRLLELSSHSGEPRHGIGLPEGH